MPEQNEPLMLLFTVTERGHARFVRSRLQEYRIRFHTQLSGEGTAPSDVLDILGIGSAEKDVLLSFGLSADIRRMFADFASSLSAVHRARGIIALIPLNAVSNLFSTLIHRQAESAAEKGNDMDPSVPVCQHSLICAIVNRGYAEKVSEAARKAGATGGTVIRSHLAGTDNTEKIIGMVLEQEREIVTILTPNTNRDAIMEAVNKACGLHSAAQGIICSLPVEKAYKL